jgi:hypothetical protein
MVCRFVFMSATINLFFGAFLHQSISISTDMDTLAYIASVERWSGIPRNKILTDDANFIMIVASMSFV